MKILNALILVIITGIIIAGCGGGSTGYTGGVSYAEPTVIPTATPAATAAPSGGGVFKVTVNIPGYEVSKKDTLTADVLPYGSKTLRVTITGEAIDPDMVEETPIPSPAPPAVTVTVSDVPVGLNEALIEVLDEGGNVIAHYKHGFYMTAGGTVSPPGEVYLGVVITEEGNYRPENIDVAQGTELYFENWGSVERTVETTPALNPAMSPIAGVTPAAQPNTAAIYHSASHTFNTAGTFTYTGGDGGMVLVYDTPHMTAISDNVGNLIEDTTTGDIATFTISGNGFGTDRTMVKGSVYFYRVDNLTAVYLDATSCISNWTDGSITLSNIPGTSLPKGKYRVKVLVRGTYTPENDFYYYKGSGNYVITVE
ncbi:MAG: hypothetical protein ABRQ39_28695 [Candidatus Eremiobacterota bacterium]